MIVGRERDLEEVDRLIAGGEPGPAVVLIEGEAGIGKTTIWEAGLAAASAAGKRVLVARPTEGEMPLAFAALADLLGDVVDDVLPELPEPQRDALAVALLLARPAGRAPNRRAVATAFTSALRVLSRQRGVVVAVDDYQWLDAPSAAAISFAERRLRAEPVAFLLTLRTPVPSQLEVELPPAHVRLVRRQIGPLSLAELQRLLHVRLGEVLPRSALRRVHAVSGGNPFFALELAGALGGRWSELEPGRPLPVPDELHALVAARLAGLSERTLDALLAAAVLSEPTLARMTGLIRGEPEEALAPAVRAGVAILRDGRVRFTHPLLASGIVDTAGSKRVRGLHRRIAGRTADPEERARHLAVATTSPDAVVAAELSDAAELAAARGAPEAAAELAYRAWRLTPAAEVEAIGRRAIDAARYGWAAGNAGWARLPLEHAAAGPLRAEALVHLARLQVHAGDRRAAADLYREAERGAAGDERVLAQIHEGLAWCLWLTREDVPDAARHARRAVELAQRGGDAVLLADALSVLAQTEFFLGGGLPSAAMEQALEIAPAETSDVRVLRQPRMHWAVLLQCADRLDEAGELLRQVHASAVDSGDDSAGPWVLMRLSQVELLAGRWTSAAELAEQGHQISLETNQRPLEGMLLCARALVYAHQGRDEEARATAGEGMSVARPLGDGIGMSVGRWALGTLELSVGSPAAAVGQLEGLQRDTETAGIVEPGAARWLGDLIEALVLENRLDDAERLTAQLEQRGRSLQRTSACAVAARSRGLLAAAHGDLEASVTALEEALALHDGLPLPFEHARTLLALGSVRRRARRRRAAREALDAARAILAGLGASIWLDQADTELARIGGRPPPQGGLTPSEERVARLVAGGRTNREVAAELVLSERTVESHLTHIYRKLGVRSRSQLARATYDG